VTQAVTAQVVAEIQVLPSELSLAVGQQGTLMATPYDSRGIPITDLVGFSWVSTNLAVATVAYEAAMPTFATIVAVSPGIAQVEVRLGNIRSTVVVEVRAPAVEEVLPAAPPDSVLPREVSTASVDLLARIEPHNFEYAPGCRVGAFVGSNLLLTTYMAIRGADSIEVLLSDGQRVSTGIRIAAYDAPGDLAVLHVPVQRAGQMTVGDDPEVDDYVWAIGQPNCRTTETTPARIAEVPSTGTLRLNRVLGLGQVGAPVVGAPVIDQAGTIVGVASDGSRAIRATDVASFTTQAGRNLASGILLTPIQVARAERHAYGSIALRSNMTGAVARIAPLEDWHWPELARESSLPLTLSGPEGRYQVELIASGAVQSTTTMTMEAGVAADALLLPTLLAQPQPAPAEEPPPGAEIAPQGGGGGGAIIAVLLVLAGGGAAAAFLLKPKETPPDPPLPPTTGGVTIRVILPGSGGNR
jgi:hypothetical protein